jgi:hypothetical protein
MPVRIYNTSDEIVRARLQIQVKRTEGFSFGATLSKIPVIGLAVPWQWGVWEDNGIIIIDPRERQCYPSTSKLLRADTFEMQPTEWRHIVVIANSSSSTRLGT